MEGLVVGMHVLVTGHQGFLGGTVVSRLLDDGHHVTGIDTGFFAAFQMVDYTPDIRTISRDVRDITAVDLDGVDAVVHLAALSNDPLGALDPELTFAINCDATLNLARLAKDAGAKRFLLSSSCSVYGAAGQDQLLNEDATLGPLTAYAVSKVRSEEELSKLADADFSPTYLRNATAYGITDRTRLDLVLNNLTGWGHATGQIRVLSDGMPWRPLVHAEDIAQAFSVLLSAPAELVCDRPFNVGAPGENYRVKELAEIVGEVLPNCTISIEGAPQPDDRSYQVDFSRFTNTFPEFVPAWDVRKGVVQLARVFEEVKLTVQDLEGEKYIRLNRLKSLIGNGAVDQDLKWTRERI